MSDPCARGVATTLLPVIILGTSLFVGAVYLVLPPMWALATIAGALGLAFTFRHPELSLLGILVLTSSVISESKLPLIPIPVGSLHISDMILFAMFGLIALRWLLEPDFQIVRTSLDGPLLTFFGVALGVTLLALVRSGLDFNLALRGIRIVSYYLVFFLVTNLIRDEEQLARLLDGFLLLATVVAVFMLLQFTLGDSLPILPGRVETLSTQGTSYQGITRVLPPGMSVVLVAFLSTLIALLTDRLRIAILLRAMQTGTLGVAVILTFNRNYWLSVIFSLALFSILVRGRERSRVTGRSIMLGFAIMILLLVISARPGSRAMRLVNAAADRFDTMMGSQVTGDSSLRWRDAEYEYAIPQILSHPLTGLGIGALYRPFDSRMDWRGFDGRAYIHNGHVWIMVQTGFLGYASLMWLSLCFLARGFKNWRRVTDNRIRGFAQSFTLVYLGTLLCNITSPLFMEWYWTPVFGLMMGANEVIYRLYMPAPESQPGEIAPGEAWQIVAGNYRKHSARRPFRPLCPYCGATKRQLVAGINPSGTQRFRCESCGRTFTPFPRRHAYPTDFRLRAVQMHLSGKSKRQVARELGTSPQSIVNWVRKYHVK